MKIKYDTNSNNEILKLYDESYEIILKRNRIVKNPNLKILNFTKNNLIRIFSYIFLIIIININFSLIDSTKTSLIPVICNIIAVIGLLFLILFHLYFIIMSYQTKKKIDNHTLKTTGCLTIDKEGIIDEDEQSKFSADWEKITYVIIGKYSINIFTESNLYFRLPITIKEEVIGAINKYQKNLKIIKLK